MKRKTNLFYNTSEDTNFITFSNYTESLTGNYLSTNTKLFPSKFLCLYIPNIKSIEDRLSFIKEYMCGGYENKMAVLRDYCNSNNINCEEQLKPLNYLLEYIYKYDENTEITFVSEITEQDYNGIYSDTICNINASNAFSGTLLYNDEYNNNLVANVIYNSDILYGWENINMPTEYLIEPIYDNTIPSNNYISNRKDIDTDTYENISEKIGEYYIDSQISGISVNNNNSDNIYFNVIIPLYDVVNINYNNNINLIKEYDNIDLSENAGDWYYKNVPMGIWFADDTVKLSKEKNNFSASWSLVLSSQFKPFPYSQQIPDEISKNSNTEAYATFSQILIKQNEVTDKFNEVLNTLNNLSTRISNLEGQLTTKGTSYSLDGLHIEMINWETAMTNKFNELANNVNTYLTSLTWQNRQG